MHKHMRSLGREREAINKQKLTKNARTVLEKKNMISERKHSLMILSSGPRRGK